MLWRSTRNSSSKLQLPPPLMCHHRCRQTMRPCTFHFFFFFVFYSPASHSNTVSGGGSELFLRGGSRCSGCRGFFKVSTRNDTICSESHSLMAPDVRTLCLPIFNSFRAAPKKRLCRCLHVRCNAPPLRFPASSPFFSSALPSAFN